MKLGICSAIINEKSIAENSLGYEIERLVKEAPQYYDKIVLIDPLHVIHVFDERDNKPLMMFGSENLRDLNTCIFRGISGAEEAASLLARNLNYCGCDILDPIERFTGAPSGKLFDSLKGFSRKILPATIFTFNALSATEALKIIDERNLYPLVLKPGRGKRGEHVKLVKCFDEAEKYIYDFFSQVSACPLILQQYIEIADEFRGIVLGGQCLGLVRKIAAEGKIAHNASQGATFIKADDAEMVSFIEKNANKKGIVGLDAARDIHGKLHYIESNRSPQWKNYEAATGVNVAVKLLEYAVQNIKNASALFQ